MVKCFETYGLRYVKAWQTNCVTFLHSLANRRSCSTLAETRDRKCYSMQLILVVGKMDMIKQICQMLSFC